MFGCIRNELNIIGLSNFDHHISKNKLLQIFVLQEFAFDLPTKKSGTEGNGTLRLFD
jgi:hypothetical protein